MKAILRSSVSQKVLVVTNHATAREKSVQLCSNIHLVGFNLIWGSHYRDTGLTIYLLGINMYSKKFFD